MEALVLYLLLGAFAGTIAGLLGVGGGLVIVPALAFLYADQGMPAALVMHMAVGTSLATIVVTSLSAIRAHHRYGAVHWELFWHLTPGIVVGAFLGAWAADLLPGEALRIVFGLFELGVALQMGLSAQAAPQRRAPGRPGMTLVGAVIGAVSAIVGIGGGSMTVPFLTWCNVSVRNAVATSSACGLPIAVAGAAGFIIAGWNESALPQWSSGYVYWPAFAGVVAASVVFAPLGAFLGHTVPVPVLRRFFAVFLAVVGLRMLLV